MYAMKGIVGKKIIFILCLVLLLPVSLVWGDSCTFRYWEVIPSSTRCTVYHLPDFQFRALPPKSDSPSHINHFCTQYEISSRFGTQEVGYCYTGSGDPIGPIFYLGDKGSSQPSNKQSTMYLADLNFEGCHRGVSTKGLVFAPGGWRNAPQYIQRSWPLARKMAECGR
jgi:hypothetical protein